MHELYSKKSCFLLLYHFVFFFFPAAAEAFFSPPRRLHGVKIAHRKAENQIKMAKMIMMNELNKRANLLIEQLEVITFSLSPSFLSCSQ